MLRKLMAGALALGLNFGAQAATTTPVVLSSTTYTDLGAGPMTLGAVSGNVLYQQSATQPAAGSPNLILQSGGQPALFTGVAHVWAIGSIPLTVAIVTTGADVFMAPGGGSTAQGTSPWVDNITQFGGSNVVTGTGVGGAGIPRITVSSDSSLILGAGAATIGTVNLGTIGTAATSANQSSVIGPVGAGTAATNSLAIGGVFNSTLPALTTGQQAAVQLDASGRQIVVGPCAYTPVAGSQYGLAITSSTPLTIPATATCATVQSIGGVAYYTTVAAETPVASASGGDQLPAGSSLSVPTLAALQGLHFIGAAGVTINVSYWK